MNDKRAKVGIGLLILKEGKILLGLRKGAHGAEQYAGPGGHLEYGETMEQCALREIAEECGITVKNVQLLCTSDLLTYYPKHYLDIGMTAEWVSGEPEVLEPEKCGGWGWYDMDNLPGEPFGCLTAYIESYKTGKRYFTFPKPD